MGTTAVTVATFSVGSAHRYVMVVSVVGGVSGAAVDNRGAHELDPGRRRQARRGANVLTSASSTAGSPA